MKTILTLTFLAVTLALATPTHAQNDAPKSNPDAGEPPKSSIFLMPQSLLARLKLSEDQKKQYDSIEKEYIQERRKLGLDETSFRKAQASLRAAEQEGDAEKIADARKKFLVEMENYRRQAAPLRQLNPEYLGRVLRILTPEQVKIVDPNGRLAAQDKKNEMPPPSPRN